MWFIKFFDSLRGGFWFLIGDVKSIIMIGIWICKDVVVLGIGNVIIIVFVVCFEFCYVCWVVDSLEEWF